MPFDELKPDPERIRQRAYFLWKNEEGLSWEDPFQNWLEAEAYEIELLKSRMSHPVEKRPRLFKVHFDKVEKLSIAEVGSWNERALVSCTLKDLESLKSAYDKIHRIASDYDYVCGFACGAIPLMVYIAEKECCKLYGGPTPEKQSQFDELNSRFHLFPGLSWGPDSEQAFLKFLSTVESSKRVMVVDLSFSGNAIARAANVAGSSPKGGVVSIHGIVDENRFDKKSVSNAHKLVDDGRLGSISIEPVPTLLSEDLPEFLGYESLNSDSTLKPLWAPGVFDIHHEEINQYYVGNSQTFHTLFQRVLNSPLPKSVFSTIPSDLNRMRASHLGFILRCRLDKEFEKLQAQAKALGSFVFTNAKRTLCGKWKSEISSIQRQMGISVPAEVPKFCKSIPDEKEVLAGEKAFIDISSINGYYLVCVHAYHKDKKEKPSSTHCIPLSYEELAQKLVAGVSLEDVPPPDQIEMFTLVWNQLSGEVKTTLRSSWNEVVERWRSGLPL